MTDPVLVTVIIPERNEENSIENCIQSIVNGNFPKDKYEILVVDGPQRLHDDGARQLHLTEPARGPVLQALKGADLRTELLTFLQILDGSIERFLDAAEHLGRQRHRRALEDATCVWDSRPNLATADTGGALAWNDSMSGYIEFLDELPHTPTGRVQKYKLRERGVTETTWDREAAGFVVRR